MPAASPWFVYLLECRNGSYYCGITNDLQARFEAHVAGRGARYTRANPPLRVVGSRAFADRAAASRAEWQLKQLPRASKLPWLLAPEPGHAGAPPSQADPPAPRPDGPGLASRPAGRGPTASGRPRPRAR
ncbi:GIY-YIG nuclease family protein [Pseudoxanthomonas composti]|uniref:GIY-YIG nuclease family protein n=1 Tax=Pseudoxanthomonas composti TaxID=2137479 RepID=A0A4Q1JTN3_9GAMM|nr:GIY-YIG nuclease family protein [Pseudoxanthomonas composti]